MHTNMKKKVLSISAVTILGLSTLASSAQAHYHRAIIAGFNHHAGFIAGKHGGHFAAGAVGRHGFVGIRANNHGDFNSVRYLDNGTRIYREGHYNKHHHYVVKSNVCNAYGHCYHSKWRS